MEREPNWKSMYMTLVGKVNEALELLPLFPENVKIYNILEAAMQDAEEIYIRDSDLDTAGEAPENS
nr:hypothetical protein [uncultured Oscillibacter sp.]